MMAAGSGTAPVDVADLPALHVGRMATQDTQASQQGSVDARSVSEAYTGRGLRMINQEHLVQMRELILAEDGAVTSMSLHRCDVSSTRALAECVNTACIKNLDLSFCRLGEEPLVDLFYSFTQEYSNTPLKKIDLSYNLIGMRGIRLFKALGVHQSVLGTSLRSLTMAFNPVTILGVCDLLSIFPFLRKLDVSYCGLLYHNDVALLESEREDIQNNPPQPDSPRAANPSSPYSQNALGLLTSPRGRPPPRSTDQPLEAASAEGEDVSQFQYTAHNRASLLEMLVDSLQRHQYLVGLYIEGNGLSPEETRKISDVMASRRITGFDHITGVKAKPSETADAAEKPATQGDESVKMKRHDSQDTEFRDGLGGGNADGAQQLRGDVTAGDAVLNRELIGVRRTMGLWDIRQVTRTDKMVKVSTARAEAHYLAVRKCLAYFSDSGHAAKIPKLTLKDIAVPPLLPWKFGYCRYFLHSEVALRHHMSNHADPATDPFEPQLELLFKVDKATANKIEQRWAEDHMHEHRQISRQRSAGSHASFASLGGRTVEEPLELQRQSTVPLGWMDQRDGSESSGCTLPSSFNSDSDPEDVPITPRSPKAKTLVPSRKLASSSLQASLPAPGPADKSTAADASTTSLDSSKLLDGAGGARGWKRSVLDQQTGEAYHSFTAKRSAYELLRSETMPVGGPDAAPPQIDVLEASAGTADEEEADVDVVVWDENIVFTKPPQQTAKKSDEGLKEPDKEGIVPIKRKRSMDWTAVLGTGDKGGAPVAVTKESLGYHLFLQARKDQEAERDHPMLDTIKAQNAKMPPASAISKNKLGVSSGGFKKKASFHDDEGMRPKRPPAAPSTDARAQPAPKQSGTPLKPEEIINRTATYVLSEPCTDEDREVLESPRSIGSGMAGRRTHTSSGDGACNSFISVTTEGRHDTGGVGSSTFSSEGADDETSDVFSLNQTTPQLSETTKRACCPVGPVVPPLALGKKLAPPPVAAAAEREEQRPATSVIGFDDSAAKLALTLSPPDTERAAAKKAPPPVVEESKLREAAPQKRSSSAPAGRRDSATLRVPHDALYASDGDDDPLSASHNSNFTDDGHVERKLSSRPSTESFFGSVRSTVLSSSTKAPKERVLPVSAATKRWWEKMKGDYVSPYSKTGLERAASAEPATPTAASPPSSPSKPAAKRPPKSPTGSPLCSPTLRPSKPKKFDQDTSEKNSGDKDKGTAPTLAIPQLPKSKAEKQRSKSPNTKLRKTASDNSAPGSPTVKPSSPKREGRPGSTTADTAASPPASPTGSPAPAPASPASPGARARAAKRWKALQQICLSQPDSKGEEKAKKATVVDAPAAGDGAAANTALPPPALKAPAEAPPPVKEKVRVAEPGVKHTRKQKYFSVIGTVKPDGASPDTSRGRPRRVSVFDPFSLSQALLSKDKPRLTSPTTGASAPEKAQPTTVPDASLVKVPQALKAKSFASTVTVAPTHAAAAAASAAAAPRGRRPAKELSRTMGGKSPTRALGSRTDHYSCPTEASLQKMSKPARRRAIRAEQLRGGGGLRPSSGGFLSFSAASASPSSSRHFARTDSRDSSHSSFCRTHSAGSYLSADDPCGPRVGSSKASARSKSADPQHVRRTSPDPVDDHMTDILTALGGGLENPHAYSLLRVAMEGDYACIALLGTEVYRSLGSGLGAREGVPEKLLHLSAKPSEVSGYPQETPLLVCALAKLLFFLVSPHIVTRPAAHLLVHAVRQAKEHVRRRGERAGAGFQSRDPVTEADFLVAAELLQKLSRTPLSQHAGGSVSVSKERKAVRPSAVKRGGSGVFGGGQSRSYSLSRQPSFKSPLTPKDSGRPW